MERGLSSTALFKDAVRRLIDAPSWVKGPYVLGD